MDSANFLKIPVNSIVDLLDNSFRGINFIPPSFSVVEDETQETDPNAELKDFDIKDTIKEFCDGAEYDEETKKRLYTSLMKLYDRTLEKYEMK